MSRPLRVLWFVSHLNLENNAITSTVASVRLRCLEIVRHFKTIDEKNLQTQVFTYGKLIKLIHNVHTFNPDLIIFGKLFHNLAPTILELQGQGYKVALDICDNIFELNHLKQNYQPLLKTNCAWITASFFLFKVFKSKQDSGEINGLLFQVDDPPEGLPATPTRPLHTELGRCVSTPLELVWYGNYPNLDSLCFFLDQPKTVYTTITVVTQSDNRTNQKLDPYLKSTLDYHSVHLLPWTLASQRQAILKAHAVLIPCSQDEAAKAKTANRLITGLWFGTPVVAYPIESYTPFEDYCFLNTDLHQGLERLLSTPWNKIQCMIQNGQEYIHDHYCLRKLGNQWYSIIQDIIGEKSD